MDDSSSSCVGLSAAARQCIKTHIQHVLLLNAANYFTATMTNPDTGETKTDTYQQVDGLAMGTNAAPQLANIWLALLEHTYIKPHILTSPTQLHAVDRTHTPFSILHYSRFIDDIFILAVAPRCYTWNHITDHISRVFNHLDSSISITMSGGETAHFLDVEIHTVDKPAALYWHPFTKPISRFLYIPVGSNHPPSMYKGMYIGCAYRLAGRSATMMLYHQSLQDAAKIFSARGHSIKRIRRLWAGVDYHSVIDKLLVLRPRLRPKPPYESSRIYVTLPFDHRLPQSTSQRIRTIWHSAGPELTPMMAWMGRSTISSYINQREAQLKHQPRSHP